MIVYFYCRFGICQKIRAVRFGAHKNSSNILKNIIIFGKSHPEIVRQEAVSEILTAFPDFRDIFRNRGAGLRGGAGAFRTKSGEKLARMAKKRYLRSKTQEL